MASAGVRRTAETGAPTQRVLTLHVPPTANHRHVVVGGKRRLTRTARLYMQAVHLSALCQRVEKVPAPQELTLEIVWFRARKAGDVDKRGAILLDALQGVAYDNDAQIADYRIRRDDTDPRNPRMVVTITPTGA